MDDTHGISGDSAAPSAPTMSDLMDKLNFVCQQLTTLTNTVNSMRDEIVNLKTENQGLRTEIEELKKRDQTIEVLKAENDFFWQRLCKLEEELDRLEDHSRRNNVVLYGIAETERESFEMCANKVVSVLNDFFPEKQWSPTDIERAHRFEAVHRENLGL